MRKCMDEHSIDKMNGEREWEPSEESVSQPSLDAENIGTGHQLEPVQNNSNEKKRALEVIIGDSDPFGSHWVPKKCRPDQSLNGEHVESPAVDLLDKSGTSKVITDDGNDFQQKEHTGSSGKRRRSRWGTVAEGNGEQGEGEKTSKRRKTRWDDDSSQLKMLGPIQLPSFVKEHDAPDSDPEIHKLKGRFLEINRKILGAEAHDERSEGKCGLSPPISDNFGVRTKSRGAKSYEKLVKDRQHVISKLIKKNPTFIPPPEYKPAKLCKKLYIPIKEYPSYNFIGLIIGPRGNNQKRMEQETGAKIMLRGKGSMKEKKAQQKPDPSDKDDLHVLVEADNQKSLDEAVKMVEKLLIPVSEGMNELKREQLRELAKLNGTLKDENLCKTCGEDGHKHYACPSLGSTFLSNAASYGVCGGGGSSYTAVNCPPSISTPCTHLGDQYHSSPADPKGRGFTFGASFSPSYMLHGLGPSPSYGSHAHPCTALIPTEGSKPNREIDNAELFVNNLPQTVDENRLMGLFSPFGRIVRAKVIRDRSTGFSKGYGFVMYDSPIVAATAAACMKSYKIDGKMLVVRMAGHSPAAGYSGTGLRSKHASPAMTPQHSSSHVWPGPPGSLLSDTQSPSTEREDLRLPPLSVFLGHTDTDSFSEQIPPSSRSPCYIPVSSPSSLAQFAGNPYYSSPYQPYFTTPKNNLSQWFHPPQLLSRNLIPNPYVPNYSPVRIPQR